MVYRPRAALLIILLVLTIAPLAAQAQWAVGGNRVAGAPGDQHAPLLVTDGGGGAIILYESDWSASDVDLYAQRIDAGGVIRWTVDWGETVCNENGLQTWADIEADGEGGAIMTWTDTRTSTSVYIQKVDAAGDMQWGESGRFVNDGASHSRIALNGTMGSFISWEEWATFPTTIVVQRLSYDGWFGWPDYVTVGGSRAADLIPDDAGGVIAGWTALDSLDPFNSRFVLGQRLDGSGAYQWANAYVSPGSGCYTQEPVPVTSDGTGGGIWLWKQTIGSSPFTLIAQRVDGTGALQWGTPGVELFPSLGGSLTDERIIGDGAGGALVVVQSSADSDIHLNRILANGTLPWTADGVVVCDAASFQMYPQLAPDGNGGAFVVWRDGRNGATTLNDIYGQHVDADGNVRWAANGVPICAEPGNQIDPRITATGDGSAIVAWEDDRNGASNVDIYAQAIHFDGSIGDPPLKVTTVWPAVNDVHVALDTHISATFNIPADLGTLNFTHFMAYGSFSGPHGGPIAYDASTNTVTLQPTSPFDHAERVTVVLTDGIVTPGGGALAPISWSFTAATEGLRGGFTDDKHYAVGTSPMAICAAKLDGDPYMDLVATNRDSDTISVLKGLGGGKFAVQATFSTGSVPLGIAAANVDLDADVDLITANSGGSVTVLRNTGTGQFLFTQTYAVPGGPSSVCAGDLNNDGLVDLATANPGSDQICLLFNRGSGTFGADFFYAAGDDPAFISSGDLDDDGYLDLVTANLLSGDISLFLSMGTPLYPSRVDIAVGSSPNSVHPADLDDDNDLDLVVAVGGEDRIAVLLNNGDGTFASPSFYPAGNVPHVGQPADLDGDQDLDLFHTNANSASIWVRLNDGTGNFRQESVYASIGELPNAIVAADFDEDGALDLASANRLGNDVSVLLNHASVTGVEDSAPALTRLERNVPNPFNPSTRIDYRIDRESHVQLVVYDVRGARVRTLVDRVQAAREYTVSWDGRDASGEPVASGVYLYRLRAGGFVDTKQMVLLK